MNSLQDQVKEICYLADAVIKNPSQSLSTTARTIGVSSAVTTFATTGIMTPRHIIIMDPPILTIIDWIIKKVTAKQRERQEKERMLRELIRRQQAIIRKLKEELKKSREQNAKNSLEIKNLRDMLERLEDIVKIVEAA